jgi:hypothetical protein
MVSALEKEVSGSAAETVIFIRWEVCFHSTTFLAAGKKSSSGLVLLYGSVASKSSLCLFIITALGWNSERGGLNRGSWQDSSLGREDVSARTSSRLWLNFLRLNKLHEDFSFES